MDESARTSAIGARVATARASLRRNRMAVRGMRGEVAVVQHVNVGDTIYAGAVAGTVGGVLFLIFAMGVAVLNGMDTLSPLRLIGATFVGAGALDGGPG